MGGKDYPRVFAELNWGKKREKPLTFYNIKKKNKNEL